MAEQLPAKQQGSDKFFQYFRHELTDIESQIDHLPNLTPLNGERADAVEQVQSHIARLSTSVRDASSSLPSHDRRTYGEAIQALQSKLQKIQTSFAPKPRFSFSKGSAFTARKNESAISLNDAAELASERRRQGDAGDGGSGESSFVGTPAELRSPAPEPESAESGKDVAVVESSSSVTSTSKKDGSSLEASRIRQMSFSQATSISISNRDSTHIILPVSAAHATTSGTLSMLHRCIVDMSVPTKTPGHGFAGLTLKNIKQSLIICGHVNGAAHVTKASNSIIVVASQQFRMHESRDCDVYLLTSSRPIIEDCSRIRFAPLPDTYLSDEDRDRGGEEEMWSSVDDFKWLRSEPSPNWSVLDQGRRVGEEVWREVVPGGPQLGTEEILGEVGLPG